MATDMLKDYAEAAVEAARRGAAVLEEWRSRFQVREKGRADLVTDADLGSQRAIFAYLAERFPGHAFLGEEEGAGVGRPGPEAPPTWIVDPLDGTTNYVHDCPLYCVSIGLQVAGELVVGVVLDPSRDELFWAARGQGAWLGSCSPTSSTNRLETGPGHKPEALAREDVSLASASGLCPGPVSRRLQVSQTASLGGALMATGFPPDMRGQERTLDWWRYFSLRTQSLRRTGSTAINLAWLAAGRFDGFWAFDNHVWDVAGGVVLVREAGGRLTNVDGTPYDPYTADALASNGLLHPVLVEAMRTGP